MPPRLSEKERAAIRCIDGLASAIELLSIESSKKQKKKKTRKVRPDASATECSRSDNQGTPTGGGDHFTQGEEETAQENDAESRKRRREEALPLPPGSDPPPEQRLGLDSRE